MAVDNRFRWTQIQPADSGEAVTAITSAGTLFSKAMESAQAGLKAYKTDEDERVQRAKDKNLSILKDRVAQAQNLAQYGAMTPEMSRGALRQQATGEDGRLFMDLDAATKAFGDQRAVALGRTLENVSKAAQSNIDAQQATNLEAMKRAAADLPPELQGAVTFDAAGNPIIDPNMGAEFGQQFAERAAQYGFQDLDNYQTRRAQVRRTEDAKYMTSEELKQAEQRVQDVLVAQEQIDDRYKGAVATATEKAETEYNNSLTMAEEIHQAELKTLGMTADMMSVVEGGVGFNEWLNDPNNPIENFEIIGQDKGEIAEILAEIEVSGKKLSDAQKIWIVQNSLRTGWFGGIKGVESEIRNAIANQSFLKEQKAKLDEAIASRKTFEDKRKSLQELRDGTIAGANAQALRESGVRNTAANARMMKRLEAEGKKAAKAGEEMSAMPSLTAKQRSDAKKFQPNQASSGTVGEAPQANVQSERPFIVLPEPDLRTIDTPDGPKTKGDLIAEKAAIQDEFDDSPLTKEEEARLLEIERQIAELDNTPAPGTAKQSLLGYGKMFEDAFRSNNPATVTDRIPEGGDEYGDIGVTPEAAAQVDANVAAATEIVTAPLSEPGKVEQLFGQLNVPMQQQIVRTLQQLIGDTTINALDRQKYQEILRRVTAQ